MDVRLAIHHQSEQQTQPDGDFEVQLFFCFSFGFIRRLVIYTLSLSAGRSSRHGPTLTHNVRPSDTSLLVALPKLRSSRRSTIWKPLGLELLCFRLDILVLGRWLEGDGGVCIDLARSHVDGNLPCCIGDILLKFLNHVLSVSNNCTKRAVSRA